MHILNPRFFAFPLVLFFSSFLSLLILKTRQWQQQTVFQVSLLKIRYLPSGWNGTALLIRDWNGCRNVLWMCKETGLLRGVLLIKGYPPTSLSSSSRHTPSISFSTLSCQVLLRFGALDSLTNTFFHFIFVRYCSRSFETDSIPNLWQTPQK